MNNNINNIYYLYIKTHTKTGLKYLGYTKSKDPIKYMGSGIVWNRHLKKHGYNISTYLIAAFDNKVDVKEAGLFWSKYYNVVESNKWANLTDEKASGGHIIRSEESNKKISETRKRLGLSKGDRNPMANPESKEKMRQKILAITQTPEYKENMSKIVKSRIYSEEQMEKIRKKRSIALKGKPKSIEHKKRLSEVAKNRSEEHKRKISETLKRKYSDGTIINPMTGKKRPDLSERNKSRSRH